jgi:hypothetical protein
MTHASHYLLILLLLSPLLLLAALIVLIYIVGAVGWLFEATVQPVRGNRQSH